MSLEAWFVLAVVVLIIGLLAFTRAAPDMLMMGGVSLLLFTGILAPEQALAGFSNQGVVIIAVLYVVVAGLESTGAISWLSKFILGRPKNLLWAQLRLMIPVISLSAFINNTPVTAMMIPAVSDWAKHLKISVSKLMMPLSYAAMLGGTCSLIGSSTNLIVNGMLIQQTDEASLSMFELAWVGVPCAMLGVLYVVFFSKWLLPERKSASEMMEDTREYTTEMVVDPQGPLVGKTVEQAGLRHLPGLYLIEIERGKKILPAISPQDRLMQNDRLVFAGVVESVVDLHRIRGLRPATDQVFKLDAPRPERLLVEAVVSDVCPLIGKTIREGKFRSLYNAAIIAVARNGEHINEKIGDIRLRAGDTLLLEAPPRFQEKQRNSRDFYLVSAIQGAQLPRHDKAIPSIMILIGLVVAVGVGLMSMLNAALLAAGLMLLLRCTSGSTARNSVDWPVLITIAGSIGLGQAMYSTGAASHIATQLVDLGQGNPLIALGCVYLMTAVFTSMISNNAAAVLMFPIAIAAAQSVGASILPFTIIIMLAASASFATPIGYQTNMMVFGPGGYHFVDYFKFGLPLTLLLGTTSLILVPLIWPF